MFEKSWFRGIQSHVTVDLFPILKELVSTL